MKPAIVTLVAALTCASFADTIRLRNGTEYEGEVLAEKDDHYVVRIQVTKSIRDERKIPKTEVLEIVAEKKDAADFEAIKDLVPTPDLLSLEDYEKRTSAVEKFLATHSKSRLAKQASEILKTLDKEREAVAAGGIKFESKIIQSGDRQSRAYPLDAQIAAAEVKRLSEARDFTGALRAWTKLEKDFGSSSAYKDLVPFAHKLFTSQKAALDKSIASFEERLNKRNEELEHVAERDRDRTRRLIESQSKAYEAKIETEKEEGEKWLSLDPYHRAPMVDTSRKLAQELNRLDRLNPASLPDGDKAWTDAWNTLSGSPDRSAATTAVSTARGARIPTRYIEILEAKVPEK